MRINKNKDYNHRLITAGEKKVDEGTMSGFVEGALPVAVSQDVFIPVFDGESEEALALRYGRKSSKKQNLVFEFTRDPALLHQYYSIYQAECRVMDSPAYIKTEEEYNKRSHILVVRQGNFVVGGGRITVRNPRQEHPLPVEIDGFSLDQVFPELKIKQQNYAELSRLALLPDFRGEDTLKCVIINVIRKCIALDVDIFFAAAPLLYVRSYRQICKALGLKEALAHLDLDIPPAPGFEEVKDYLLSVKRDRSLDKFLMKADDSLQVEAVQHEDMSA